MWHLTMLTHDIYVQGRQQLLTTTTTVRVVEGLSTKRGPPPLALYPTGFWQHGRVIWSIWLLSRGWWSGPVGKVVGTTNSVIPTGASTRLGANLSRYIHKGPNLDLAGKIVYKACSGKGREEGKVRGEGARPFGWRWRKPN